MAGRVYPGRGGAWLFLLLAGCIWDKALYDERKALLTDDDGDGFTELAGDCDDGDDRVNPDVVERCDGVDQDCDQLVDEDAADAPRWFVDGDGDGLGGGAEQSGCVVPSGAVVAGGDCDDTTQAIPGAEVPYDGVDQDCDGADLVDVDGDGSAGGPTGVDCDDADAAVHPGAEETWENGATDNDCDGGREGVTIEYGFEAWTGPTPGAELGRRISWAHDIDGNGRDEVVASAPYDATNFAGGGGIYLLEGVSSGSVTGTAAFLGGGENWFLEVNAKALVDVDGDGVDDFPIAGPGKDDGVGAVWVVPGSSRMDETNPESAALVTVVGAGPGEYLGASAVVLGDVDGDGIDNLAVGSPLADGGGLPDAGLVGIFSVDLRGTVSILDADILIAGPALDASLGNSIEAAGDQDDDGLIDYLLAADDRIVATVVPGGVSAPTIDGDFLFQIVADDEAIDRTPRMLGDVDADGRLDLGLIDEDVLIFTALPTAPMRTPADPSSVVEMGGGLTFFYDLGNAGDLDGDGRAETLVPAQYFGGIGSSLASIFFGDQFTFGARLPLESATLQAVCVRPNAAFGYRIASGGDIDGNGQSEILLAGYSDDEDGSDAGAVITLPLPE